MTGLRFNHDVIANRYNQYVTAGASPPVFNSVSSDSSNAVVGDIALKQQIADNVMGYLSYSRGYSPAAYNTSAVLTSTSSVSDGTRQNGHSPAVSSAGLLSPRM